MKRKTGWLIFVMSMLLFLSGCFSINEPITAESEGIWNNFFVYPLSQLMIWIANWIKSYGFAIIIVTVLFRILLLPLTIKQTKSMRAMQQLQPKMQALKETYSAKDRNTTMKLNQEMQALFSKHKVNPFSGCLPLLIQMPIFLAIYHAIMRTDHFEGETFAWFALTNADPYFILPVLACVLTFLQQKMMMVQNSPQMKILLYAMPIMILVIGVVLPAAVVLYWIAGNVFMILQTYFMNRSANVAISGQMIEQPVKRSNQQSKSKKKKKRPKKRK
ncbi:membrane protein insertase YidC [Bacillus sp. FSL W7-1360]